MTETSKISFGKKKISHFFNQTAKLSTFSSQFLVTFSTNFNLLKMCKCRDHAAIKQNGGFFQQEQRSNFNTNFIQILSLKFQNSRGTNKKYNTNSKINVFLSQSICYIPEHEFKMLLFPLIYLENMGPLQPSPLSIRHIALYR